MLDLSYEEIVAKIVKEAKMQYGDVEQLVEKKMIELSSLVSKRGAAHIVANELGIKVVESPTAKELLLKDAVPGLNNITILGRVVSIFPKRDFETKGRKGSVVSVMLSDGSVDARLVFWNDKTKIIESGRINVNDILKVYHVRSKQGLYGLEFHLTNRSRIDLNPAGIKLPEVKGSFSSFNPKRFLIQDLQAGVDASIRACLVQLFERNPFYEVCPDCGKKLSDELCLTHGKITPAKAMVLNAVFDDGTGTIRCVFFREQAESLLGCSTNYAVELSKGNGDEAAVIKEKVPKLLGSEFMIAGKVNHNSFNDRLEVIVRNIMKANHVSEAKLLL